MKRFFYILLLVIITKSVFADLGYCFRFKVKFNLKGDSSVTGYYIYPTYNLEDKNLSSIDDKLKHMHESIQIEVYKELIILDSLNFHYKIACRQKDLQLIKVGNIVSTEILEYYPCCYADKDYSFCGTAVITELSDDEIMKLQTKKSELIIYYQECYDQQLTELVIVSYNKSLTETWIKDKVREMSCVKNIDYENFKELHKKLKQYFRTKNIIIFQAGIGN